MIEEKMREEFEAWWESAAVWKAAKLEAWLSWKASRESLVIELPNPISEFNKSDNGFVNPEAQGYDDAIEDCRESIHAAGVKTK